MFEEEEEEPGFFRRHRILAVLGALILLGGRRLRDKNHPGPEARRQPAGGLDHGHASAPAAPSGAPPTPPPEQPPPEQVQPEQKMEEQAPVQEKKPNRPRKKPPDAPAPLGTSITGPGGGPDLGLGSGLGGGGGYGKGGGGGGSKYGWYAGQVQSRIAEALRNNPRTRRASLSVDRARLAGRHRPHQPRPSFRQHRRPRAGCRHPERRPHRPAAHAPRLLRICRSPSSCASPPSGPISPSLHFFTTSPLDPHVYLPLLSDMPRSSAWRGL